MKPRLDITRTSIDMAVIYSILRAIGQQTMAGGCLSISLLHPLLLPVVVVVARSSSTSHQYCLIVVVWSSSFGPRRLVVVVWSSFCRRGSAVVPLCIHCRSVVVVVVGLNTLIVLFLFFLLFLLFLFFFVVLFPDRNIKSPED